jgi:plasmid stabilization system protein ParE
MPKGSKSKYTDKQKRQAEHIEESYEDKGTSHEEAERRAWSTVNKTSGGGEKSGSGKKKSASAKKSARSESAKKAAATRKRNAEKKSK